MLKNSVRLLPMMLFLAGSFSTLSYAEIFTGEIIRTGSEGSSFNLRLESTAQQKKNLQIWVSTETQFKGLSSLLELVSGDEVIVTAQRNVSNDERWEADVVELSKVVIRDPGREVSASEEIVEEKVDRAQTANTADSDLEIAAFRTRFTGIEAEINALKSKVVKIPDLLQEKRDVLMGELLKKKIMTEAKLNEYLAAGPGAKNEIFKAASLLMTELEEILLRTRQELLEIQS